MDIGTSGLTGRGAGQERVGFDRLAATGHPGAMAPVRSGPNGPPGPAPGAAGAVGQAAKGLVGGHGGHQQLVHGALGHLQQAGRGGKVQVTPPSSQHQLVQERPAELEEALDGLAQRDAQRRRHAAIGCRFHGGGLEMLPGRPGSGAVEMRQQLLRQQPAVLPEPVALALVERHQPRGRVTGRACLGAVGTSQARRSDAGAHRRGETCRGRGSRRGGTVRGVGRRQAFQRAAPVAPMAARGGEGVDAAGVTPASQRLRGHAQQTARGAEPQPVGFLLASSQSHQIWRNIAQSGHPRAG